MLKSQTCIDLTNKDKRGTFGCAITTKRKILGLSVDDLAHRVGVANFSIRAYETGKYWPSRETYDKLIQVFPDLNLMDYVPIRGGMKKPVGENTATNPKPVLTLGAKLRFGSALHHLRTAKNMTLKEMGVAIGCSLD